MYNPRALKVESIIRNPRNSQSCLLKNRYTRFWSYEAHKGEIINKLRQWKLSFLYETRLLNLSNIPAYTIQLFQTVLKLLCAQDFITQCYKWSQSRNYWVKDTILYATHLIDLSYIHIKYHKAMSKWFELCDRNKILGVGTENQMPASLLAKAD